MSQDEEQLSHVAAKWRDAVARMTAADPGTPERNYATADAARYEISHGIAMALVTTDETYAGNLLRQRREATESLTITRVVARRPDR